MTTKLLQVEIRLKELKKLAKEVLVLAEKMTLGKNVQPEFSLKGQRWYRGAREILVQNKFSGIEEFDNCYEHYWERRSGTTGSRAFSDIEQFIKMGLDSRTVYSQNKKDHYDLFLGCFHKAQSLLESVMDEILSREMPIISQLSFSLTASEFEKAEELLNSSTDITIIRASGVVVRVALERHLLTVIETRSIKIICNPPNKPHPTADDLLVTLLKNNVITAIQKSELESLFKIGNNCAHPKEVVKSEDVNRLILRGKELASSIL